MNLSFRDVKLSYYYLNSFVNNLVFYENRIIISSKVKEREKIDEKLNF